ncbi:hypothetical protein SAMN05421676_101407 [Salinibacillus kushneri]|uniref:Uncharacterized protein n=1 Tax=Salinibacillus kushneri TaxID=237682 RepID=A0A1H9Z866_9BACI|nr:hypothetical protein [Salinibacillus kushneri]SES77058.1 hypothetical protein SAMN05421676_101407 [Salinibacillus kushneri]
MLQTKISREEIKEIARKISTQSQLPKQYFDLGTILLVNVSFHNDPDHFWEYEVFKLDNKGNAYSFESVTVNMRNDEGDWLFSWLLNWERETFDIQSAVSLYTKMNTYLLIKCSSLKEYLTK